MPLDILLVTGRFPQRSETFVYRKATALAQRGHRVTVLSRDRGDWALYPAALPETLTVEVLPTDSSNRVCDAIASGVHAARAIARSPLEARALYERCRMETKTRSRLARTFARQVPFLGRSADVIHFEFLGIGELYPHVGGVVNTPVIVSCRGQDVHLLAIRTTEQRARTIDTLRRANAVHCVSSEIASVVNQLSGRSEGVWVNRPAVDVHAIRPRPPTSSSGPLRILVAGRLVWVKGMDYLLVALAKLVQRGVAIHVDIVGEGEMYSALRFSIDDLRLSKWVTLVGGVSSDDVLTRLQSTDVFVLPSVEEGISNGVLEALASGVPVVTTNAGGMNEAVADGIEGFVVPIRNAEAIADRLATLAADPAQRIEMGLNARVRAEREFSLERQIDNFESLYRATARSSR